MNSGKTVFRQLLQFLPRHDFNFSVRKYRGEHWVKSFTAFDQFLCLAYAQLSGRESLRDIETCLNSHRDKLYHVGFRGAVSRTTLADANERRDYRIFEDFGHVLIGIARNRSPHLTPPSFFPCVREHNGLFHHAWKTHSLSETELSPLRILLLSGR